MGCLPVYKNKRYKSVKELQKVLRTEKERQKREGSGTKLSEFEQAQELAKNIEVLQNKIKALKEETKVPRMIDTMEYKRFQTLEQESKVRQLSADEEQERFDLENSIDQWFTASGTIVEGVRISDIVKQKVSLEENKKTPPQEITELTEEDVMAEVDVEDKKGQAASYKLGLNYDGIYVKTKQDDEDESQTVVVISGVKEENLGSIFRYETEEGETEPINFEYKKDDKGNIVVTEEEAFNMNQTPGRLFSFSSPYNGRTFSALVVFEKQMDGSYKGTYAKSDNNLEYKNAPTSESIYDTKPGDAVELRVDTRDQYNKDLLDAYAKAKAEVAPKTEEKIEAEFKEAAAKSRALKSAQRALEKRKKQLERKRKTKEEREEMLALGNKVREIEASIREKITKEPSAASVKRLATAKENLKKSLRVTAFNMRTGQAISTMKGKRKGESKAQEDIKYEAFRNKIFDDETFLDILADKRRKLTKIAGTDMVVKKILVGIPNFSYRREGEQSQVVYGRISEKETGNILDVGYITEGEPKTKNNTEDVNYTFLRKAMKNKTSKKNVPFIVVQQGSKRIAFPVKIVRQQPKSNQEIQEVFQSNMEPVAKVEILNRLLAERRVDITKDGNFFFVVGNQHNITQEFLDKKLEEIEAKDNFYASEEWMGQNKEMKEILSEEILVNIDLTQPFHSPKVEFDFSGVEVADEFYEEDTEDQEEEVKKSETSKPKKSGKKSDIAKAFSGLRSEEDELESDADDELNNKC